MNKGERLTYILNQIQKIGKKTDRILASTEDKAVLDLVSAVKKATNRIRGMLIEEYGKGRFAMNNISVILAQIDRLFSNLILNLTDIENDTSWGMMNFKKMVDVAMADITDLMKVVGARLPKGFTGVNSDVLISAFDTTRMSIMGATEDVKRAVSRTMQQATFSKMKWGDIERALFNEDMFFQNMSEGRLSLIAHSELFKVYRTAQKDMASRMGVKYYQMEGPIDTHISMICRDYIGRVLTEKEWLGVEPMVFIYGLHPHCRHRWIPVFPEYEKEIKPYLGGRLLTPEQQRIIRRVA